MSKITSIINLLIVPIVISSFPCVASAFDPEEFAEEIYQQVERENRSKNYKNQRFELYGLTDTKNYELTRIRIKAIASTGDTDAMLTAGLCELGVLSGCGWRVHRDVHEAVKWFREGDRHGDSRCTVNLALAYYGGIGVRQNQETAISYLRKAANQEDAIAQYDLGMILKEKKSLFGLIKNSEAKEWL